MVFILRPVRTLYVSRPLGVYLLAEYVRSRAAKKTITSAGQTGPVVSARFVPRPLLSSRSSNLRNVSASGACTAALTARLENHRYTLFPCWESLWYITCFHRSCNIKWKVFVKKICVRKCRLCNYYIYYWILCTFSTSRVSMKLDM